MPFRSRPPPCQPPDSEFGPLPAGSLQAERQAARLRDYSRPFNKQRLPDIAPGLSSSSTTAPIKSFSRPFDRSRDSSFSGSYAHSSSSVALSLTPRSPCTSVSQGSEGTLVVAERPKPGLKSVTPRSSSINRALLASEPEQTTCADLGGSGSRRPTYRRIRSKSAAPESRRDTSGPRRARDELTLATGSSRNDNLRGTCPGSSVRHFNVPPEPTASLPESSPRGVHNIRQRRSSSAPSRSGQRRASCSGRGLPADLIEARNAMMAMWLYQGQLQRQYASGDNTSEGVVLKVSRSTFTCCPTGLRNEPGGLFEMVQQMNVRCAMTVNTIVVRALMELLKRRPINSVPLAGNLQVQILKTMEELPGCQLHHFAAFIEDRQILVVWDDDPKAIFNRASALEESAVALMWNSQNLPLARDGKGAGHVTKSEPRNDGGCGQHDAPDRAGCDSVAHTECAATLESGVDPDHRPTRLATPCIVALALALCITTLGVGWRTLVRDSSVDCDWTRMGIIAVAPTTFFFSLYFFYSLVSNLFLIFGPNKVVKSNSRYYAGVPPRRGTTWKDRDLPHVTIQMPVYKEGLHTVIRPTVMSLKTAISTYEMQGGTASIFINDDGMQMLSHNKAQERREFYEEHNIGWVARPTHNPAPLASSLTTSASVTAPWVFWAVGRIFGGAKGRHKGHRPAPCRRAKNSHNDSDDDNSTDERTFFIRRGKFKKASNMNYALHVSNRVEEKLSRVERPEGQWSWVQEDAAYDRCLEEVLHEDRGRTWAEGNVRMGEYILLVDCDTRVPADCLLDGVTEMDQCPEVAILQYTSGVMQLTDSYFENGIAWFANLIYSAITFAVASGDCCPFVGHNAMLRWEALQDGAGYSDKQDGYEKYWSEMHVSEDFDMALRLQMAGWSLRYVSYTGTEGSTAAGRIGGGGGCIGSGGGGVNGNGPTEGKSSSSSSPSSSFQEGVSLTVYDELARWEKYAYGCSELLFNPLREWPRRGPLTTRFLAFVLSPCIRLPVKLTVASYMGTYFAISLAWLIALFNFLFMGWFAALYRSYYLDSFAIYVSLLFVFPFLGNIALAMHRYRLRQKGLGEALWENFKWVPMFMIFLGGISIHISQAIAAHILGIEMTWGATAKEVEHVGFGDGMARILRRFRGTFCFVLAGLAAIIVCRFALPRDWQITELFAIYPLAALLFCHLALPILLDPALMTFTW